jgi:hypothetical protein
VKKQEKDKIVKTIEILAQIVVAVLPLLLNRGKK